MLQKCLPGPVRTDVWLQRDEIAVEDARLFHQGQLHRDRQRYW